MVVLSPHLDDAVFGCGQWLAEHPGAVVVTLFAGVPRDARRRTDWDARFGFRDAAEAIAVRRDEDACALALLGAVPRWLDFADSQYGETPPAGDLAGALRGVLRELRPQRVLLPLGLFHSDHLLAHDAGMAALRALPGVEAWAYEDCLYRGLPGRLQRRLASLLNERVGATPARVAGGACGRGKAAAVQAYASQLRAFGPGGYDDAARPERYWRLEPVDGG